MQFFSLCRKSEEQAVMDSQPQQRRFTLRQTFRLIECCFLTRTMVSAKYTQYIMKYPISIFDFSEEWRNHKTDLIHKMEVFMAMKSNCRRRGILEHFGEELPENATRRQRCCDNCSEALLFGSSDQGTESKDESVDYTKDAALLLEAVIDCKGYYGLGVPVTVLKATHLEQKRAYLRDTSSYGRGKHRSKQFWMALGRALQADGYIQQKVCQSRNSVAKSYTTVQVSPKGWNALLDHAQIKLVPTMDMKDKTKSAPKVTPLDFDDLKDLKDLTDLKNCLHDLRNAEALKMNLAPYMIFSEEVLSQIAVRMSERSFWSFSCSCFIAGNPSILIGVNVKNGHR